MLVKLFEGVCINPELVKHLSVRGEQVREGGALKTSYAVGLKTDGDEWLKVGNFDDKDDAVRRSEECCDRINAALKGEVSPDPYAAPDPYGADPTQGPGEGFGMESLPTPRGGYDLTSPDEGE